MGTFHGRSGAVTWTTLTHLDANVFNWSVDLVNDAEETTAFGIAAPWARSYIPGLIGWSGSYEARTDDTEYPKASDMKKNIKYGIAASEIKHESIVPPLIVSLLQSIASLNVVTSSIKNGINKTPIIKINIPIKNPKKKFPLLFNFLIVLSSLLTFLLIQIQLLPIMVELHLLKYILIYLDY